MVNEPAKRTTVVPKRSSGWISPRELSNALDIRIDYLRRNILPSLAPGTVKKEDGQTLIYGRSAIEEHLFGRALREARKVIKAEQAAIAQHERNEELDRQLAILEVYL